MWSNGVVADDVEPLPLGGEDSPWARDVPIADPSPLPTAWQSADVEVASEVASEPPSGGPVADAPAALVAEPAPTPPSTHRRAVLVAGLVGLLAAAAIGSQLVRSDDHATHDPAADSSEPGASATTTTADAGPSTTERTRARTRTSTTVGDVLPEPVPQWELTSVALSPRLGALTVPTELVALTNNGLLYLIDVSTGSVRSIDTELPTTDVMLGIGRNDIMLGSYNRNDVLLARVGEPLTKITISGGPGQVLARPGTDEFIVVPNMYDPISPYLLRIGSDDRAARMVDGPMLDVNPWEIKFLPATGELIVNDSGGVYVIDETGQATRVSTGDLAILGANHYLVRECGDTRDCGYVRIDQHTGERVTVDLPDIEQARRYGDLSSAALSPDGTALSYYDWSATDGSPSRRLFDFATGTDIEVAPSDQYGLPGWAPDGSGLFVVDGRGIAFFDRATGELAHIAPDTVLDSRIVAVAVRPVSG